MTTTTQEALAALRGMVAIAEEAYDALKRRHPQIAKRLQRKLNAGRAVIIKAAEKRQADFENVPTSVDYDNDCAP